VVQHQEIQVADAALAAEIGCPAGSRWLRLDMLRLGLDEDPRHPMGISRVYVAAAYEDIPKLLKKSPRALLSTLIENHYGRRIAEVEQTVQAVAVPAELAAALDASAGSPALKIVRRYLDQARELVEATVTLHPGDRLVSKSLLKRQPG
jgi:GntR family transcriptional regulator